MVQFNCPHCGFEHSKDDIHDEDFDSGEHQMECVNLKCGFEFTITVEYEMHVSALSKTGAN